MLKGNAAQLLSPSPYLSNLDPAPDRAHRAPPSEIFVIERLHEEICASWVHLHSTSSMSLGR
jgi:hypothetical protein